MKKLQSICLLLILSLNSLAQVKFEKGYIIDKDDKKTECFIKNSDWNKSPVKFKYKLSEDGEIQTGDVTNIKEFNIPTLATFRAAEVDIDMSSNKLNRLSRERKPEWERKKVFLKVLVDGSASLYFYESDFVRFFYSLNKGEIKQLIYKEYLLDDNRIAVNNSFRQQLLSEVNCSGLNVSIESINYFKKDLIKYFQRYNQCVDPHYVIKTKKNSTREIFDASIAAGVSSTSLSVLYPSADSYYDADFGNKAGYNVGLDLECILPFQNNKWSLLTSINYQEFAGQKKTSNSYSAISLKYMNADLWLRHYFFLSNATRIYIGASINVVDYMIDGKYSYLSKGRTSDEPLYFELTKLTFRPSFSSVGLGLKYKRTGLEARYSNYTNVLLSSSTNWKSNMHGIILLAKYSLFKVPHK